MNHSHLITISFVLFLFLLTTTTSHASSSSTITASKKQSMSFINQFLIPHNKARSALGLRPLAWDSKLAHYAEWYANQRRNDCVLKHSTGPYGENLAWSGGTRYKPAQAVNNWVLERQYYNYRHNSCSSGQMCGHYTQVVWKSTTKVGCARVVCSGNKGIFITCNYDPPGNYIGQRPY